MALVKKRETITLDSLPFDVKNHIFNFVFNTKDPYHEENDNSMIKFILSRNIFHWSEFKQTLLSIDHVRPIIFQKAVAFPNKKLLCWLKKNYFDMDRYKLLLLPTTRFGHIVNLNWLKNNTDCSLNCNCCVCMVTNSFALTISAARGDLSVMQWLYANGCRWNNHIFKFAANNGNLDMMKWLKKNGCPWNAETFSKAVIHGNLENIQWLYSEKCPWDENVFMDAVIKGDIPIINFLFVYGCPWNDRIFDLMNVAPQTKQWLQYNCLIDLNSSDSDEDADELMDREEDNSTVSTLVSMSNRKYLMGHYILPVEHEYLSWLLEYKNSSDDEIIDFGDDFSDNDFVSEMEEDYPMSMNNNINDPIIHE